MRGLLLLTIVALVVVTLWSLRGVRLSAPRRDPGRLRGDRLVKDPVCQTYVVSARAIARNMGGRVQHFCSQACADRYVAAHSGPGARDRGDHPEGRRA